MSSKLSVFGKLASFKYILISVIIVTVVTLFILTTYGPMGAVSHQMASLRRSRVKFKAYEVLYRNDTFRLFGRYLDKDTKASSDVFEIEIDQSTVEKLKLQFVLEKRKSYPFGEIKVEKVNCRALFDGNQEEQNKTREIMAGYNKTSRSPDLYVEDTLNCKSFKQKRGYVTSSLTPEEENFPIAFSILMFKDVEQTERLLRAIYRPQNVYCIHVDSKAHSDVRKSMTSISACFDNVFLASRSVDVQWGTYTVLEPELVCMKDLWRYKKWRYFINLTGQEFPLKTNRQLVEILKAYNGANDLESTIKNANKNRWEKAGKPPHNITAVKGSVHITVSRGFVDYVLHNETAADLLEWAKKVDVPDETYFTSLNHNPHLGVPGSYKGEPEHDPKAKPFLTRFKNWGSPPYNWPCAGQRVRLICIFGIGDLPLLEDRKELFANKFYWDYEPYALDCMEELNHNRTRDEYAGLTHFDASYYKHLAIVTNKV
ncbi:beta-1,3-galactosyl-O-glycosyl-glycoprotein beta-1,6-N-acetylglucosaminyltransferase-like [Gigantopelta aegis]|uniref:beta-1,3-galactosyl-O-glycosyl-glycoprotein beta-1,6-N-acetylglucosaminyltransferase-like n=1 Tax=Gigantopelta aegis TaxID=1735272 RepID=UPI001B8889D9|nr:beta-1,3-galactosyl-O-glycosyl-glycoprotein beta-1,6-N-acetylglucosaminyltransferase-like [Gigantopelta aegis]